MIQWYAVIWLALLRTSRGEISGALVETDVFDAATRRLQYLSDDDYALVEQCYERNSYLEINDFLTENLGSQEYTSLSVDYAFFVAGNGLAWCLGGEVVSALVNGEAEVICSTDYMEDGDFTSFVDACAEIGGAFLVANVTRTCLVESGDSSLDQVENFFNMPDCVNQTKAFACDLELYANWLAQEFDEAESYNCTVSVVAEYPDGTSDDDSVETTAAPAGDQQTVAPTAAPTGSDEETPAPASDETPTPTALWISDAPSLDEQGTSGPTSDDPPTIDRGESSTAPGEKTRTLRWQTSGWFFFMLAVANIFY
jgi:hypothetical protein